MFKHVIKDIKIYCDDKLCQIRNPQLNRDKFYDDGKSKIEIASTDFTILTKHLNSSST